MNPHDGAELLTSTDVTHGYICNLRFSQPTSQVDKGLMETLMRVFHDSWKGTVESINNDVLKSFASFKLGGDILKQARHAEWI